MSTENRIGYVLSEGLSNINPLSIGNIDENNFELSKSELISSLSVKMDVGEPSRI